jgi:hypothetical protein
LGAALRKDLGRHQAGGTSADDGYLIWWERDRNLRQSGMVRWHQTRNLEVPGSMLRISPERRLL